MAQVAGAAAEVSGEVRAQATALGGGAVVENWPDGAVGIDPWGPPGGPLALMQALKAQYDPRETLNPGRYVGGI